VGEDENIFFWTFKKRSQKKNFPDKNQLIKGKKIFIGHARIQLKVKKFF
jgi:hypothetical protein